jgi:hypothetical protein
MAQSNLLVSERRYARVALLKSYFLTAVAAAISGFKVYQSYQILAIANAEEDTMA